MKSLSLLSGMITSVLVVPAFAKPQLYAFSNSTATAVPFGSGSVPSGSLGSAVTPNPNPPSAIYTVPSPTAPITAAPPIGSGGVHYGANWTSPANSAVASSGLGNITYVHLTRTQHITVTVPGGDCTINVANANLLYWDAKTYTYSSAPACQNLGVTDAVVAQVASQSPFAFPTESLGASARYVNYTTPGPVVVGSTTSTGTQIDLATSQTFTISGFTDTQTISPSTRTYTGTATTEIFTDSGGTYTGSQVATTSTFVRSGATTTFTFTDDIYATPSFPGPTDVLRPDVSYNNASYAYTATYPTPYVFYSVFEVERAASVKKGANAGNGSGASLTSTITVPVPYLSAYAGNPNADWSGHPSATGALPAELVAQLAYYDGVDIGSCVVGTYRGTPTVDVAVTVIAGLCAAPAHQQSTVAGGLGPISLEKPPPVTVISPAAALADSTTPNVGVGSLASPTAGGQGGLLGAPVISAVAGSFPAAPQAPQVSSTLVALGSIILGGLGAPAASLSAGGASPGAANPAPASPAPANPAPANPASANPTPANGNPAPANPVSANGNPAPANPGGPVAPIGAQPVPGAQPNNPTTVTVGNVPIAISSNNVIINSQTFKPASGSPPLITTIGNQPIIINPSQVVAGGSTFVISGPLNEPPTPLSPALQPPSVTIKSSVITANAQSQFVVSGQTLSPGGAALTIDGTEISLAPSAASIVVGGKTTPLLPPPVAALPTAAGQQVQVGPNSDIIIPGVATLSAGAPAATISGTIVSLLPSGSGLLVGSKTIPLPLGLASSLPTIAGQQIQKAPNGNIIIPGIATLTPGGPAASISGTVVSVAPNDAAIVIGGSTIPLPIVFPTISLSLPSITFGAATITANSQTQFVIGGQTLTPGSAIIVLGTLISLASGASNIVIGGSTAALAVPTAKPMLPSIMFGSSTITANSQTRFVIGGQTLAPGSAITVSGTVISLAPGASDVVVGGSTEFLAVPTATGSANMTSFLGAAASDKAVGRGFWASITMCLVVVLGMVVL